MEKRKREQRQKRKKKYRELCKKRKKEKRKKGKIYQRRKEGKDTETSMEVINRKIKRKIKVNKDIRLEEWDKYFRDLLATSRKSGQ